MTLGYITRKFLTWSEIHPGMNSTLPMIKALFVVTLLKEVQILALQLFQPCH